MRRPDADPLTPNPRTLDPRTADPAPDPGTSDPQCTLDEAIEAFRDLTPEHRRLLSELGLRRRTVDAVAEESGRSAAEVSARLHAAVRALAAGCGQSLWPEPGSHADVAAAALGVLPPDGQVAFARHLVSCHACCAELTGLQGAVHAVAAMRRYATVPDGARPDQAVAPRAVPTPATGVVRLRSEASGTTRRAERDARRARVPIRPPLLLPLAATVGLLASGGVVAVEELGIAPGGGSRPGQVAVRDVTATDPRTGVTARMRLRGRDSGTEVWVWLTDVRGPRTCRLVAIATDGSSDVLATVQVPTSGFGTRTQPDPLSLSVSTPRSGDLISRIVVESVVPDGGTTTLVAASP